MKEIVEHGLLKGAEGEWRTRVELVVDRGTKLLVRRRFTIWDTQPSRHLDFTWTPDGDEAEGIVSGEGALVWRLPNRAPYDPLAVRAIYRGRMQDGRPDGQGEYRETRWPRLQR